MGSDGRGAGRLVPIGPQEQHAIGERDDAPALDPKIERVSAVSGRGQHEPLQVGACLRGHPHSRGPLVPGTHLAHDRLVQDGEARGPQEGGPLQLPVGPHVARITPPLDLPDECRRVLVVVPQDVLDQEGAAGPEHAGHLAQGGQQRGEVMGRDPARDRPEGAVAEGQRLDVSADDALRAAEVVRDALERA